jgi:predicted glycogen debranching enzyme
VAPPLPECFIDARGVTDLIEREWLVTNGIGGYSSGTVDGAVTRRYHGMLVAALKNPLGRMVMLNALHDELRVESLIEFRLDGGVPVWRYAIAGGGGTLTKRIVMPHRQNTVVIQYRLDGAKPLALRLTPAVHFRPYEAAVSEPLQEQYGFAATGDHYTLMLPELPPLRFLAEGRVSFDPHVHRREQVLYPVEESRGYAARGSLWSPGSFVFDVQPGEHVALIASTELLARMQAIPSADAFELEAMRKERLLDSAPPAARRGAGAQLVIAADQFVIKPVGRVRDTLRATAVGDELRTVIAGYHWFTDWGRDTMISLEGLMLTTGRHREAGFILRTFAQYVRDGLIPNFVPDGSDEGVYHTADATLWFFHALERYAQVTGYWTLVEGTLPTMREIVDAHMRGTRFGIGVDPEDGLLRQGAEHYQLTWMDAKVDGWVVTPRRGKAVEINALWYNALCLLSRWECDFGDPGRSQRLTDAAARVRESFNRRFWNAERGYLYDVLDGPDGDDPACRPNQVLAIALPNPVLDEQYWKPVLAVIEERLLTPVGLRSLAADHADYKSRYFGDLRARDAAYHQGTVWGWLIGPWIDAWLKLHPDDPRAARRYLDGLVGRLHEFGVGSIAEIFDAEAPYAARGCVAQAWSVAEALRCWVKTAAD